MCEVQVILQCQVFPPPLFTAFSSLCCCGDPPLPSWDRPSAIHRVNWGRAPCVCVWAGCLFVWSSCSSLLLSQPAELQPDTQRYFYLILHLILHTCAVVVGSFVVSTELCCCCLHLLFKLAPVWRCLKPVCVACVSGASLHQDTWCSDWLQRSKRRSKECWMCTISFRPLTLALCDGDIKVTVVTEFVTLNTSPFPSP